MGEVEEEGLAWVFIYGKTGRGAWSTMGLGKVSNASMRNDPKSQLGRTLGAVGGKGLPMDIRIGGSEEDE